MGVIQAIRYIALYFDNMSRIDSDNLRLSRAGFFSIDNPK